MRAARPVLSRLPGGCDFAADPAIAAADQPIFWTEAASPVVLRFDSVPPEYAGEPSTLKLLDTTVVRRAEDGLHAVWRLGLHQLQGHFDSASEGRDPALVLPLDEALDLRALTAIRLVRLLTQRPPTPDPAPLSIQRRTRLVHVIRALDARADGASLREVARGILGHGLTGRAWQDSDIQGRTKRLVRSGVMLMRGGYRELLNPLARRGRRRGDEIGGP